MDRSSCDRYPGPKPYRDIPEHHRLFFGRLAETHTIAQQIIASRIFVLFGKSGLGKSSVLAAGVFPSLRKENYFPIRVRLSSSSSPMKLIADSCEVSSREFNLDFVPGESGTLWEYFKTAMFWKADLLLTPILVFDQFEEIFTSTDAEWRRTFARDVGSLLLNNPPASVRERLKIRSGPALSDSAPAVKVVIGIREDYLAALQELSSEMPGLFLNRFRLLPLDEDRARSAIEEPAKLEAASAASSEVSPAFCSPPFGYEPTALAAMLKFLKGRSESIEPFYLQLLCQHVEQTIVPGKPTGAPIAITTDDLGDERQMARVLEAFYTDSLNRLPINERRRAHELCDTGLLSPGGRRLMLQENQVFREFHVSDATLKYLVNKSILRKEARLESVFYEISHDTLAQSILKARRRRIPKKYRLPAAVGTVALIILGILGWSYNRKLIQERNAAREASRRAEEMRKSSDFERTQAEKAVAFLIGEDFLGKIRPLGRIDFLQEVQNEVNQLLPKDATSNTALQIRGLAFLNQGDLYNLEYRLTSAQDQYQRAQAVFLGLQKRDNKSAEWRRDFANATAKLAAVRADQLHVQEALVLSREALRIRKGLAAENADSNGKSLSDEAESYVDVGNNLESQGHLTDALNAFEEAVRLGTLSTRKRPSEARRIYPLEDGLLGEGDVLQQQGKMKEAEVALTQALTLAQRAAAMSRFEPEAQYRVGSAINKLANLWAFNKPEQALNEYKGLYQTIEKVTQWDPENKRWERDLAATYILIGEGYAGQGESENALTAFHRALKILNELKHIEKANASLDQDLVWLDRDLGGSLADKGHQREAVQLYDDALGVLAQQVKIDPTNSDEFAAAVSVSMWKAQSLSALGDFTRALKSCQQALSMVVPPASVDPTDAEYWDMVGHLQQEMGRALAGKKDFAGAAAEYSKALASFQAAIERGPYAGQFWNYKFLLLHDYQARMFESQGNEAGRLQANRDAEKAIEQAVQREPTTATYRSNLAIANRDLGAELTEENKTSDALAAFRLSEQAWNEAIRLKSDPSYWDGLWSVLVDGEASLYSKAGDKVGMSKALDSALATRAQQVAPDSHSAVNASRMAEANQSVGDLLAKHGETQAALAAYGHAEKAWREALARKPDPSYWNGLWNVLVQGEATLYGDSGDKAAMNKTLEEGLEERQRQTSSNRRSASSLDLLGRANEQVGDILVKQKDLGGGLAAYKRADQLWREAIKVRPDVSYWDNLYQLVDAHIVPLYQKQRYVPGVVAAYREALDAAKQEITLAPNNATYRTNAGWADKQIGDRLQEQGELSQAEDAYRQCEQFLTDAIKIEPKNAVYWEDSFVLFDYSLAPLREQEKEPGGALTAYRQALDAIQKAVKLNSKKADYYSYLAQANQQVGDKYSEQGSLPKAQSFYEAAETGLRTAIRMDPSKAEYDQKLCQLLRDSVGTLREKQGNVSGPLEAYHQALQASEAALKIAPNDPDYYEGFAKTEWRIGRALQSQAQPGPALAAYDRSAEALQKAVSLSPNDSRFYDDLYLIFDNGIVPLRFAQKDRTGVSDAIRRGQQAASRAAELEPANPSLHHHAAIAHLQRGDDLQDQGDLANARSAYDQAQQELRAAIDLRSGDARYWNELCTLMMKVGDLRAKQGDRTAEKQSYDEARKAIEQALKLDPQQPAYRMNQSRVEANLKKLEID